jgi:hypothetical protein
LFVSLQLGKQSLDVGGEIRCALRIYIFFIPQFTIINAPINMKKLRRFDDTIAHWSVPVRQFFRNLQTRRAFIVAFTSEK